jgi:hypothetical protein
MTRAFLPALALVLAITAAGCGSGRTSSARPSTAKHRSLTNIQNVDQLRRAFNTASGEPRLVVIVSPT